MRVVALWQRRQHQRNMQAAQAALQVVAGNAANVNTDGYSRKVVQQQTQVVNGSTRCAPSSAASPA